MAGPKVTLTQVTEEQAKALTSATSGVAIAKGASFFKKLPRWVFIMVPCQLLLVGVLVGAMFIFKSPAASVAIEKPVEAVKIAAPKTIEFDASLTGLEYGPLLFWVNAKDKDGRLHHVRIQLKFKMADDSYRTELDYKIDEIRDELIDFFGSKPIEDYAKEDLRPILKTDIINHVNSLLENSRIRGVTFIELIAS